MRNSTLVESWDWTRITWYCNVNFQFYHTLAIAYTSSHYLVNRAQTMVAFDVMHCWVIFTVVINHVIFPWSPVKIELLLLLPILQPEESHIVRL